MVKFIFCSIINLIIVNKKMYIGGVTNADILMKEVWDNSADESVSCSHCDKIFIDQNWNGYSVVGDNGRGIPISMSKDKIGQTSCDTAVSYAHSGSKFLDTNIARSGQNGIGLTAVNSTSEEFIIMSKVTQENYNTSLPIVEEVWNSYGPRSKKDIFYIVAYRKGKKFYEGCDKLDNLEKMIFGASGQPYEPLPRGFSTITMFKPDSEIFESTSANIPIKNIQYFLLIQEKLYKKKVEVMANRKLVNGTFKPYQFEIFKTIIPADTSKNSSVTVYTTFEVDPELGQKVESGSISGLSVEQGVHISYIEGCYEEALKNEFKIKHKYLLNGLKICVIIIAGDVVFNSQTKERLKSISKVKQSDFGEITKEFQKIFRNNPEYWQEHVARLNYLADSMKSLSAAEKAQKMIEDAQGRNMFKSRVELVEGFSDATGRNRWDCELFLCFTGDMKVYTCDNRSIPFTELVKKIEDGEEIYTYANAGYSGSLIRTKILAAKKIGKSEKITTISFYGGEYAPSDITCTPDHLIMNEYGGYTAAGDLMKGDKLLCWYEDKQFQKVKKVVTEDREEDVYCLEVEAPEHNFTLSNGVIVKNCEGLSAGGSLKSGRYNTLYHACLPLRGKILSVADKTIDQALDNKEIHTIFKVIGLGMDVNNITKDARSPEEAYELIKKYSRYGKIIIAVD